ncbi:precorrin-2 dehydrogenase/sirohydrochlorin ferrochelatase family protein [Thermoanaerobacter thermohydrosulfuricus]|uniref:precorrin-2 dehydrogenase/sirohydrochlorin ferrochelatase family protein n=1 Tax=Thermoanaerobacter thermohydrosulfuricus TaxID=1516 RepID=UPI00039D4C6A|nr:NAD(P)-dependent oxidoreductase [Thermoanaerobacter thermohydrosulfuricus]
MAYYPVMLNIKNKKCLVVGDGKVALRKILSLVEGEALVTAISPSFDEGIIELAAKEKVELIRREYQLYFYIYKWQRSTFSRMIKE